MNIQLGVLKNDLPKQGMLGKRSLETCWKLTSSSSQHMYEGFMNIKQERTHMDGWARVLAH